MSQPPRSPADAAEDASHGGAPEIPAMLEGAPDAVILLDAAAVVLDANEQACRSLGYAHAELVGKHVSAFVEGLDGGALEDLKRRLVERGVATARARHRRKDGTLFPVETRLALVRRSDGPPLIVAFARDLSAEEASRRALRESEARYARLVELLPDGVITYDAEGRITFANAAAARLRGVARPEDVIGESVLDHVHPDSWPSVGTRIERLARGEGSAAQEERVLRADGTTYPAEVAASPLGSGEVIVVVRDVSERRRVEAERTALEARLRQAEKLEALGTLAGGVAHDFNNVLAAILGHADVLAAELRAGDPRRHDAEQIAAAARRAKGVVQQILAFARRGPAEARPVDVARAVREEMALVRAAMPASLEIVARIDPSAGAVLAEPTQLHQVLLNLCANARDAMQDRSGVVEVTVSPAEVPGTSPAPAGLAAGRYVRLSVRDAGQGMDEATRARAFEPYFTTKPPGSGSGLGLAVVHGIASALGGAAALESAPGRGTVVEVWLPRAAQPAGASPPPAAARTRGSGRILLVDDDPPVARAVGRMLERLGYDVTTCADAADALARFRAEPARFDAVLTDETLPGMRGHELTRELLAIRPDVPVLICTGYSEHLDEERARALGARGLFMKPLDVAQLGEALRAALAG